MALISAILWSYTTAFEVLLLLQREANKHYHFLNNLLAIMVKHWLFITYNCILQLQKQRGKKRTGWTVRFSRVVQRCLDIWACLFVLTNTTYRQDKSGPNINRHKQPALKANCPRQLGNTCLYTLSKVTIRDVQATQEGRREGKERRQTFINKCEDIRRVKSL